MLSVFLSLLFFNSTASASSVFDDAYITTSTAVVDKDGEDACDNVDITANWAEYILDKNKWYDLSQIANPSSAYNQMRDSFISTLANSNGVWSVSELEDAASGERKVYITWTEEPATIQWNSYASNTIHIPVLYSGANVRTAAVICDDQYGDEETSLKPVTHSLDTNGTGKSTAEAYDTDYTQRNLFVHANNPSFNYNYPSGYAGLPIVVTDDWGDEDLDGDELPAYREAAQGTSDTDMDGDTDNDGLSDLTESIWFEDRDDVFCRPTSPYACAYPDPIKQDVYLEIDWMDSGTESYKPNSTQLGMIEDAFANHDIHFHADTGEYGGGNELPMYLAPLYVDDMPLIVDMNDLRYGYDSNAPNFDPGRQSIWRYMISGYNFAEYDDRSGIATAGGDDLFVSYGMVKNEFTTYTDLDTAIAGTIMHELGHSLCLTSGQLYVEQPEECVFAGIHADDDIAYALYLSSMNYDTQFEIVDFSDGSRLINDHDDWAAVKLGMHSFNGTRTELGAPVKSASAVKVAINIEDTDEGGLTPEKAEQLHQNNNDSSASSGNLSPSDNSAANDTQPQALKDDSSRDDTSKSNEDTPDEGVSLLNLIIPGSILILGLAVVAVVIMRKK